MFDVTLDQRNVAAKIARVWLMLRHRPDHIRWPGRHWLILQAVWRDGQRRSRQDFETPCSPGQPLGRRPGECRRGPHNSPVSTSVNPQLRRCCVYAAHACPTALWQLMVHDRPFTLHGADCPWPRHISWRSLALRRNISMAFRSGILWFGAGAD